jgi:predicted nuclease of restriction endonuclease-like (RecB) superfamily
MMMSELSPSHQPDFDEIVVLIWNVKQRTLQAVNTALVDLYWRVGEYISRKIQSAEWGDGVVDELARFIAREHRDLKGFTRRNLYRMRQFYETYAGNLKVSPLVTQIHPSAPEVFRDSYLMEFLDLPEPYEESDLQLGLVQNLKSFLLELGREFCFVGEHYRLQVGMKDFYIDLLFFHRGLRCLVAFELKVQDFQPAHLGQLNFYLEALDREVKLPDENPSVGILLCKSRDQDVVEYAMNRTLSPALVAEYQTQLPNKALLQERLGLIEASINEEDD